MSKQPKIAAGPKAPPTVKRKDELVFAPLHTDGDSPNPDIVSTLRAINGYVEMRDDKALEGELKNRLVGKMFTLDNMGNSDFYHRKTKVSKSNGAKELVSRKFGKDQGLYEFDSSTKLDDFSDLSEVWESYVITFLSMVDAVLKKDCPASMTLMQYKYHLLVNELELIGSKVFVVHSSNHSNIGVSGLVLNEDENTLRIITEANKIKTLPKNVCTFKFQVSQKRSLCIFGPDIAGQGRTGSVFRTSPPLHKKRTIHPLAYF